MQSLANWLKLNQQPLIVALVIVMMVMIAFMRDCDRQVSEHVSASNVEYCEKMDPLQYDQLRSLGHLDE